MVQITLILRTYHIGRERGCPLPTFTCIWKDLKIASLTRLRDQAQAEVALVNRRLIQMELKTPSDGVLLYLTNNSQGWLNAKPFKVGDNVWPGSALAEIPDLNTLEMEAKLEEIDRGRVLSGQQGRLHIDALPEKLRVVVLAAGVITVSSR